MQNLSSKSIFFYGIDKVNKARALHKYSFLKLQNNEKNKIDPTLMPLYRKRKKEKETKWGGVGDLKLLKSGHMRLFPTLNNEEILEYLPLKSVHESFGFGLCSQVNGGC